MDTVTMQPVRLSLSGWRKARNLTQREMANRIGVSEPTYVRWEKDPSKISLRKAVEISRVLNTDFDNILFFGDADT